MAIGGKSSADWSNYFQDAYKTGGVDAENAARAEYANAYYDTNPTIQRPSSPVTAQDIQTPIYGNVSWDSMPQGGAPATNDPFAGGRPSGGVYNGTTKTGAAGAPGGYGAQNPYLQPMMQSITDQVTSNFNRNVMPQISQQMMATGGYGGSRQGVIEANAMRDMNQGLSNSLANLGLQDFNAQRGYDLGLRGNDLGYAGLDAQIAQNNFGNRLAGANFGLNLFNQGMANNQTGINAGTNIQNTPMNYWSQFGNQYNSIGQGFGTTTGSASQQGNPLMGALGGAQLGSQIGNWWGTGSPNAAGGANAQGWGTGSGYGNQDLGAFL